MIRQSFTIDQVTEVARDYYECSDIPSIAVLPSNRGSVAITETQNRETIVIKYADHSNRTTEDLIEPARSVGLTNESTFLQKLGSSIGPLLLSTIKDERRTVSITEYISGHNILDVVTASPEKTKGVMLSLIQSVEKLHDKGVVHGDIHPGNLIYESQYQVVKLLDFELSHYLDGSGHIGIGLGHFLAPEVCREIAENKTPCVNQAAETFSLTVTCLSLLTGRRPGIYSRPDLKSREVIYETADGIRYDASTSPHNQHLADYLKEVLEADYRIRPQSPQDFYQLVREFL